MSIIQQHTSATLSDNWRIINIDALTEDSSVNFDVSTLHPAQPEISEADVRGISGQVRQLLRGGDSEGALRGCLETPVYNGTDAAKVCVDAVLPNSHRKVRRYGWLTGLGRIGGAFADYRRSAPIYQGQRHEPITQGYLRHRGR